MQNKMGIHARPAAMIVRITNKFKAEVFVEKDEEQVNGKSIMGLMMLAAGKGSKVKFIVTGDDAPAMIAEVTGQYLKGVIKVGERLLLLDLGRIFTAEEITEVNQALPLPVGTETAPL